MSTISVEVKYNEENNNIVLNLDIDKTIKIDTTGDIDFTNYVKELTFLIEKDKKLILEKETFEDPKLKIIQETIEKITTSFNEVIDKDFVDETEEF